MNLVLTFYRRTLADANKRAEAGGKVIEGLEGYKSEYLTIFSRAVLRLIQSGDPTWETMVPGAVAEMIKKGRLYVYVSPSE